MCKIYKNKLLRLAKKMFGKENDDWYLQEDNDSKHMPKKCQEWKQLNNTKKLPWPVHSADYNPIENVWTLVKGQIKE